MQRHLSSFSSWAELLSGAPPGAHVLQLYDREAFLVRAVTHFAAEGLGKGECVILTGTPAHLEGIRNGLRRQGVDPGAAIGEGAMVAIDVDEAVESVWRGGGLSQHVLRDAVQGILGPLTESGRKVRWWGETADAILRRGGDDETVLRWDRIGYEAAARHGVQLLCSLACDRFAPQRYAGELQALCGAHTHVIPADDYVQHRLAVNRAIAEVVGEIRGSLLQSLSSWKGLACDLPSSQALLFWLREALPERFEAVLARARFHHGEGRAEAA